MISLPFLVTVLTFASVIAMAAVLLNVTAGWAGMYDLGVAGQLAFGCYSYALLTGAPDGMVAGLGLPVLVGMVGAGILTGLAALLIGWPTLRLRGEYFLITTFAFAEIIRQIIVIQRDLTGGMFGLNSLARPLEGSFSFEGYPYALLAANAAGVVTLCWVVRRIADSGYGLTLRAARDNEPLAMALGKDVARLRMSTYVFSGFVMGLLVAPAYAWFLGILVPSIFTTHITFLVWTALVVGGLGGRFSGVLGAVVVVGLSELLRTLPVGVEHAERLAAAQPLMIGVLLVVLLRWRPGGLVSESRSFGPVRRRHGRLPDPVSRDRTGVVQA